MNAACGLPPSRWPTACLAATWCAALWVLAAGGRTDELVSAPATLAGVLLFSWLVCRLTRAPAAEPEPERPPRRAALWAQVAWLGLCIAVTGFDGLVFHGAATGQVPLWDTAVRTMGDLGERLLSPDWVGGPRNALANPTAYLVLPLAGLLLLGARFRSLGFGKGHRVLVVTAALCALPVAWIAYHAPSPQVLARALLGNTLQNGPFEEFLFRGALLTRLVPLVGGRWALGVQALAFGLWHLGAASHGGEDLLLAAAHTIVSQGATGWLFGVVMLRTRNLWASSIVHVVANTAATVS